MQLAAASPDNCRGMLMDITGLIVFLAIGAVAGWLAGKDAGLYDMQDVLGL